MINKLTKFSALLCLLAISSFGATSKYSLEQSLVGAEVSELSSDSYLLVSSWGPAPVEIKTDRPVLQSETAAYLILISNYLTGDSAGTLAEGVEVVGGWKRVGWFGYFFGKFYPWVYHQNFGWIYISEKNDDGTWFHLERLGWIWTNKDSFPSLYLQKRGEWTYVDLTQPETTLYDYRHKSWFLAKRPYVLTGTIFPAKGGTVSGYGEYYRWDTATLSASPSEGYQFVGWGGYYSGDAPQASFEILGDATIDASFLPLITPSSEPQAIVNDSLDLINRMEQLTPKQKERSMAELLIHGKSQTSGLSILPEKK